MDESNVGSFRVTGRGERPNAEEIISGTSWETADVITTRWGELAVALLPVASRSAMGHVVGRPAALHLRVPGYPGIPAYVAERIRDETTQVNAGVDRPDSYAKTTSRARSRAASLTIARETWVQEVAG
ncbi:hypothetical protein ACQP25_33355 [Microtetraspora malaysiensis]|uniref:hypothetical protein n=1 Tax=Microtetraspora malaysiensis TaxID=161358 RepID=UPI003D8DD57C